jgi:hypothetical protein
MTNSNRVDHANHRTATDWEPIEVSLVPVAAQETDTGFDVWQGPPICLTTPAMPTTLAAAAKSKAGNLFIAWRGAACQ